MSEEANIIFQWIGVGVVLLICILYIVRKIRRRPLTSDSGDIAGCEGCPLLDNCSKKSCSGNHHSGNSCCH